jgi:hypothetical protein
MSAPETAARVLGWALAGHGPPPTGDVRDTDELAYPSPGLAAAIGELAAVTAARLRLGWPPLGDATPPGPAAAVLAAAIGARAALPLARLILEAISPAESPAEWLARHGVVAPALEFLPSALADDCLTHSPLTALLTRPGTGQDGTVIGVALRILAHPAGRLALQLQMARPAYDSAVLNWRRDLLNRLRLDRSAGAGPDFVLDVYEAALVHHGPEVLSQIRAADAVLSDPEASADNTRLDAAQALAGWWGPLSALERANGAALRARRYLGYDHRKGIALYRLAQRMVGGPS